MLRADKRKSAELTQNIHKVFDNVFNGIGCFEGTFSLQFEPDSRQAPLSTTKMCRLCATKPFKDELDWLQRMVTITPLGVDEMAAWCNSFVLVPKASGKVSLCLDPAQLNQALIRPIH